MNNLDYIFGKEYRIFWMGLSIIWVILLHISANIDNNWLTILFGRGYLGVDVFFMLSTYGLCYSYNLNNINHFYYNRFKRIFPTYIVYLITLFLFFGNEFDGNLFILGIYQFTGIATFRSINIEWFIPALIILYVFFPLIYQGIRCIWIKCKFLLLCLFPILAIILSHYGWTSLLWLAAPRFLIVYITILLFLARNNKRLVLLICLVPALCHLLLRADYLSFSPALFLPIIFYAIGSFHPSFAKMQVISYIGKFSLEIYLAQSIAIQYFARVNVFNFNQITLYFFSAVLIVLLSFIFHYTNKIWAVSLIKKD